MLSKVGDLRRALPFIRSGTDQRLAGSLTVHCRAGYLAAIATTPMHPEYPCDTTVYALETDCLAGVGGLELRNPCESYVFEMS
jgi:hypothetical protein